MLLDAANISQKGVSSPTFIYVGICQDQRAFVLKY